jgi:hypothetical protein
MQRVKLIDFSEKDGCSSKLTPHATATHPLSPPNKKFTLYWVKKRRFRSNSLSPLEDPLDTSSA